jgi:hypothetical protein
MRGISASGRSTEERRETSHVKSTFKATRFERKYHATWVCANGLSSLAKLGTWMCTHPGQLVTAPRDLLIAAAADVHARLPGVAAREPTRRHQKHFMWLLRWHLLLIGALARAS